MKWFVVLAIVAALYYTYTRPIQHMPVPDTQVQVLSGDRLVYYSVELQLAGLRCPAPDTSKGREAKALLQAFAQSRYLSCEATDMEQEPPLATCQIKAKSGGDARDVAAALRESGLCQ